MSRLSLILLSGCLCLTFLVVAVPLGSNLPPDQLPPQVRNPENPIATFDTTMGAFKAEIFLDRVPRTASNFIDLTYSGFYTGIHFHRVVPNFMVQFGCPFAKDPNSPKAGEGGPDFGVFRNYKTGEQEERYEGGNIIDEFISKDSNLPGTLAMANDGNHNTGGSQFFFNVQDNRFLDWFSPGPGKHPVFGQIIDGYDVVVAISKVETKDARPIIPIKMRSIIVNGV
eukprot:gnl/TRDRNA2_/TRDRNA2_173995_c0_seq1.p1 gnl/TRDRNA2_/TRDRNA2_173995_c0~~gnl/TRDRNA2_/TRDRNA2_173995_c0_seq1.p1  ORF type:complete len:226 (-),score=25.79 gnl/TRDRNA2_/TRDRNA2_173995_c0_seq1:370-1047(-)